MGIDVRKHEPRFDFPTLGNTEFRLYVGLIPRHRKYYPESALRKWYYFFGSLEFLFFVLSVYARAEWVARYSWHLAVFLAVLLAMLVLFSEYRSK
jgi:hypothetical protein